MQNVWLTEVYLLEFVEDLPDGSKCRYVKDVYLSYESAWNEQLRLEQEVPLKDNQRYLIWGKEVKQ